jgi:hypothetical protein
LTLAYLKVPSSRAFQAIKSQLLSLVDEQEQQMDDLDQEWIVVGRANRGTKGNEEQHLTYVSNQSA